MTKVTCPKSWNYQRELKVKALTSCMGLFSLVHLHSVTFTEEGQFTWASQIVFFFKLETVITDFLLEFFKLDFFFMYFKNQI